MNEPKVKYKKVDSLVHGEVKEIQLIGEDKEHENEKLIAFWYLRNYVTKDELTTVAKIHCETHNKSVYSVEYTYYNGSSTGAIFECN